MSIKIVTMVGATQFGKAVDISRAIRMHNQTASVDDFITEYGEYA